jgi:uncharacterized protein YkwD
MNRRSVLATSASAALLAACGGARGPVFAGNRGKGASVYKITPGVGEKIPFRILDALNALRSANGGQPLAFNAALNAAALTHSRDMSVQNRPWHFGSDGSSPLLRTQRVGYTGRFLGELISETFETELETLSAWMTTPDTRGVLMDPAAHEIGFAWFQETNGKIWWTLMTGG